MISEDIPRKHTDRSAGGSGRDDEGLWDLVTQDVKPLRNKNMVAAQSAAPRKASAPSSAVEKAPFDPPAMLPAAALAPGHQEVDRRTAQKLKKGRFPVDVSVDLHGLTQAAAHKRLRAVLLSAYARRLRCVLVITGKGRSGEGAGVIKRSVPEWLHEPALRRIVLRMETAQPEHGGGGALYVLLRRQRTLDADAEN